jgi:probable non-F420 flavinoid oxidoreductase
MCSDHFLPWSERQGQSGFAWSWLGAALEATSLSFGTVCAPGQRYHPAIIAQAGATLAQMYPGRFWLAVGSGENLNEHITGDSWPAKEGRDERLRECVDMIRRLWAGETVTHRGRVRVSQAKLYTLPPEPPLLFGAAITAKSAEWLGSWADGLITVGNSVDSQREAIDAFRQGGGAGKPVLLQSALSYAPSENAAIDEAWHQWRHCAANNDDLGDLATPGEFDARCETATRDEVRQRLLVSSSLERFVEWLSASAELGFDAVYLHHVGRDLERFIDDFGRSVLPKLQRASDS